jgi:hypothetical protein
MTFNEDIIFGFPGRSPTALFEDFTIAHAPDPKRPRQFGLMALYAAEHGGLAIGVDGSGGEDLTTIQLTSPLPWAEHIILEVTAKMHERVAMIGRVSIVAPDACPLIVNMDSTSVTVNGQRHVLEQGSLHEARSAVTGAADAFFTGAATRPPL